MGVLHAAADSGPINTQRHVDNSRTVHRRHFNEFVSGRSISHSQFQWRSSRSRFSDTRLNSGVTDGALRLETRQGIGPLDPRSGVTELRFRLVTWRGSGFSETTSRLVHA